MRHRLAVLGCLALIACGQGNQRSALSSKRCPSFEYVLGLENLPGFPGVRGKPGMVTSMNPGMNIAENVFELDVPFGEATAFYERCLAQKPTVEDGGARFQLPGGPKEFPRAIRYVAFEPRGSHLRAVFGCDGCY